jgi:L-arabinose isomerase
MNVFEAKPSASRPDAGTEARVGVFGIGLAAYWPQFPGLRERLIGYQQGLEQRLMDAGVQVESGGLVDDAAGAREAGAWFARKDLDLLICYVGTYATSSQVLPVVQQCGLRVLVLNLQPCEALDYENTDTGEWLANCSACCVPEISNAFARARVPFHVVSGTLHGQDAWDEILSWCRAAAASRAVRKARLGFLGHTYPGMLDMYTDFTAVHARLGSHVEVLELCDLARRVPEPGDAVVQRKLEEARSRFAVTESVHDSDLLWAAQAAVALDRLVEDFDLQGLAYYYRGLDGNEYERLAAALILGNSLLTARGVPASGEGDLKNCIAMLIMDRLGAGGSYTEFYAMDFRENFVLMGHDGPGHIAISDEKPVLRGLGLYHGKRGAGVSVEFKVKTGPVTILGFTQAADASFKMVAAEGESIPGPILRIGNTNSRLRFRYPPAEFLNRWCMEGPTHHCALGIGRRLPDLRKTAALLDVPLAAI